MAFPRHISADFQPIAAVAAESRLAIRLEIVLELLHIGHAAGECFLFSYIVLNPGKCVLLSVAKNPNDLSKYEKNYYCDTKFNNLCQKDNQ